MSRGVFEMNPEKEWQDGLRLRIIEVKNEKIILDAIWGCDVRELI